MSELIHVVIDGRPLAVPEGTLIVTAARRAGVEIPVFCSHPSLQPVGMCRMCLVEVGRPQLDRATGKPVLEADGRPVVAFGPKLETSCTTPVTEGMVVLTASGKVQEARKDIIEFLLTSHPLDCPVCDKGGECPLQNQTLQFGPGVSRFDFSEKQHLGKRQPLGDLILLDQERCIQCGRCVRFQEDLAADPVIAFYLRGRKMQIATFSVPGFASKFSGNTTDICPVGALTTADFRFGSRPWEVKAAASVCPHCPVGCNLSIHTRREAVAGGGMEIKRVMPRQNRYVNDLWICDKGRFGYHFATSNERLRQPLLRQGAGLVPGTWEQALERVAEGLRIAGTGVQALLGDRLANEDLFALRALVQARGGQVTLLTSMGGGEATAQVGVGVGTDFAAMGPGTTILLVATDLEEEAPLWWLRIRQAALRGAVVLLVTARGTKSDRFAARVVRCAYGEEAETVSALQDPEAPGASPALREAARAFSAAENAVILFGSDGLGSEETGSLARACANLLIATGHFGKPNNGLIAVWPHNNTQGASDLGLAPGRVDKGKIASAAALYVAGADPVGDDPELAAEVRQVQFVLVQELFLTETARLADVVLPAQSFVEREGTYTSGERRVQRFYPALPPLGQARPDWQIAVQVGQALGVDLAWASASQVFRTLAEATPAYAGLTYAALSQVEKQWPPAGYANYAFTGTVQRNEQGMGVQVPSAAERGERPRPGKVATRAPSSGRRAVPITRLYDSGTLISRSAVLGSHRVRSVAILNPADAEELGLLAGQGIQIALDGRQVELRVLLEPATPRGIVLLPRSASLELAGPTGVEIRLLEEEA